MSRSPVEAVADATGDSEDAVLRKGLESYVERELREARIRINEIKTTYDVESIEELEVRIADGSEPEHPTWEEVIEWENLQDRVTALEDLSTSISN
ncbi:MAG: hypothetical protein QXG03_08655 [Halalkalicoccus sp.]